MKKIFKALLFIFVLVLAGLFAGYTWYTNAISINDNIEKAIFIIPEGEIASITIQRLEDEGIIKSALATRIYLQLNSISTEFRFGEYEVVKNNDINSLLKQLSVGAFAEGVKITIKEGLRDDQVADKIAEEIGSSFSKSEFINIVNNPRDYKFDSQTINNFLNQDNMKSTSISGMLFPDTYVFAIESDALTIVERMLENFIIKTQKLNQRDDFANMLVLASIIEKEASMNDDYDLIASVFKNRLRDGILLQSDATVNFITKKNDPGVTFADAAIDSPYNTYKYLGLPPSPISNPGLRSIEASYTTRQSEYFYFFHFESKTYFSRTYEQHVMQLRQVGLL